MIVRERTDGFCIDFLEEEDSVREQVKVMLDAAEIFAERNGDYRDNWRRFGWRGALFQLRMTVERAWNSLWDQDSSMTPVEDYIKKADDPLDCVNFACFLVRSIREGNRDGTWWQ